jgi:hypothetical protein
VYQVSFITRILRDAARSTKHKNAYLILDLRLLVSHSSFLPSDLNYITTSGSFVYLLMDLQGPGRIFLAIIIIIIIIIIVCSALLIKHKTQTGSLGIRAPCTVYLQCRHMYTCTHVHTLCAPQLTQFTLTTFSCFVYILVSGDSL